jgi:hypothetical protein
MFKNHTIVVKLLSYFDLIIDFIGTKGNLE